MKPWTASSVRRAYLNHLEEKELRMAAIHPLPRAHKWPSPRTWIILRDGERNVVSHVEVGPGWRKPPHKRAIQSPVRPNHSRTQYVYVAKKDGANGYKRISSVPYYPPPQPRTHAYPRKPHLNKYCYVTSTALCKCKRYKECAEYLNEYEDVCATFNEVERIKDENNSS